MNGQENDLKIYDISSVYSSIELFIYFFFQNYLNFALDHEFYFSESKSFKLSGICPVILKTD